MIVVDTNVVAAFLLKTVKAESAERLWWSDSEWHAPVVWRSEFRNVVLAYYRKGFLTLQRFERILRHADLVLPKWRVHEMPDAPVLELGVQSGCTAYDCEYLVLAQTLSVPLATWDKELISKFPEQAIEPERLVGQGRA